MAACDDSDQEEWIEEAFGMDQNGVHATSNNDSKGVSNEQKDQIASLKKKRKFYYYALVFNVKFEHDDDIVYFAFSQPYPYTQIISEIIQAEDTLKQQVEQKSPDKLQRAPTMQMEQTQTNPMSPNANPQSDENEVANDGPRPQLNESHASMLNKVSDLDLTNLEKGSRNAIDR